jgi:Copper amine oxidase N-terminal domain
MALERRLGIAATLLLALVSVHGFHASAQEMEAEAQDGGAGLPRLKRNTPPRAEDQPGAENPDADGSLAPDAAESGVSLTLTGGEVIGKQRGRGKASVVAEVENHGGRELKGIRVAAYYNNEDLLPPDDAKWRVHEFVFEPPLRPGAATTLRFADDNAGEYILLEVRHVVHGRGVSFAGRSPALRDALVDQDGELYISTRDLLAIVGGKLSFDGKTGYVTLERGGNELRFKKGRYLAKLNGDDVDLKHLPLEIDNRSYISAEETARLLGLTPAWDAEQELLKLDGL